MPTPIDLLRIKELFLLASDLPAGEWAAALDQQGATGEVRAKVLRQLRLLDRTDREPATPFGAPPEDEDPEVIGPYRVVRRLGRGGMGVVYLAEQQEPIRRQLAIKRIRSGMGSASLVRRFEAEREALARMDHPGIARVFDAGLDQTQRPYVAMEFVDGVSLLQYADDHQLSIEARLALIADVCRGVQHAHQRGVLHRDLKPSNVLVTEVDGRPVAKIIDFGLAKALSAEVAEELTSQPQHTRAGLVLGTPEYMSPEQADPGQLDVDTRSDVYSLGVMLYELLTGALPSDGPQTPQQPPRPSTRASTASEGRTRDAMCRGLSPHAWSSRLRGDLDWVTMRAIEPEKERRYASPGDLADEIERHLRHEAVMAGPPTAGYRLRKFVRRYRVQVAAAALVVLSLAIGTVVSVQFALDASAQALLADQRRESADRSATAAEAARVQTMRANEFLQRMIGFLDPDIALAPELSATDFLDRTTSAAYAELEDQPSTLAEVLTVVGRVYWLRGEFAPARTHLVKALSLRDADDATTPQQLRAVLWPLAWLSWQSGGKLFGATWRRGLNASLDYVSEVVPELSRPLRTLSTWTSDRRTYCDVEAALAQINTLAAALPDGDPHWIALADVMLGIGDGACFGPGRDEMGQRILAMAERMYLERAQLPNSHSRVALLRELLVGSAYRTGHFERGAELALASEEALSGVLPPDHWYRAVFRAWRGAMRHRIDADPAAALRLLEPSVTRLAGVVGVGTSVTIGPATELIAAYEKAGRLPEARALGLKFAQGLLQNAADLGGDPAPVATALGSEHEDLLKDLRAVHATVYGATPSSAVVDALLDRVILRCRTELQDEELRQVVYAWLLRWTYRLRGLDDTRYRLFRNIAAEMPNMDSETSLMAHSFIAFDPKATPSDREAMLRKVRHALHVDRSPYQRLEWSVDLQRSLATAIADQGRFAEAITEATKAYQAYVRARGASGTVGRKCFWVLSRTYLLAGMSEECVPSAVARAELLLLGAGLPEDLNHVAWAIVRVAGLPAATYGVALDAAAEAERLLAFQVSIEGEEVWVPSFRSNLVNTHGLAQYRCGHYRQAIAACQRSEAESAAPKFSNQVCMALAHYALGEHPLARKAAATALGLAGPRPAGPLPRNSEKWLFYAELERLRGTDAWPE